MRICLPISVASPFLCRLTRLDSFQSLCAVADRRLCNSSVCILGSSVCTLVQCLPSQICSMASEYRHTRTWAGNQKGVAGTRPRWWAISTQDALQGLHPYVRFALRSICFSAQPRSSSAGLRQTAKTAGSRSLRCIYPGLTAVEIVMVDLHGTFTVYQASGVIRTTTDKSGQIRKLCVAGRGTHCTAAS